MGIVDYILTVTCLLLWVSWRSAGFDPLSQKSPATLVGTLRRAEPRTFAGWQILAGLIGLLVLRAIIYWAIGSPADWTPKLHLGVVVLAFRSDVLRSVLLYSLLSFGKALVVFYFWLLVVVLLGRTAAEPDPILKFLRLHLGWIGRWPWPVQVLIPPVMIGVLWMSLHPLLAWVGVLARTHSVGLQLKQSLLLTLALVLTLKFLLPVFLLLYLVASYIYFGDNPVWSFIGTTARSLLAPLRRLPLRVGKVDLRPVVGAVLILLLLHWLPNLVQSELSKRALAIWPQ